MPSGHLPLSAITSVFISCLFPCWKASPQAGTLPVSLAGPPEQRAQSLALSTCPVREPVQAAQGSELCVAELALEPRISHSPRKLQEGSSTHVLACLQSKTVHHLLWGPGGTFYALEPGQVGGGAQQGQVLTLTLVQHCGFSTSYVITFPGVASVLPSALWVMPSPGSELSRGWHRCPKSSKIFLADGPRGRVQPRGWRQMGRA